MPDDVLVDVTNPEHTAGDLGLSPGRTVLTNAADALGLDEPLQDTLKRELEKSNSWNPPVTAALDDHMPPGPPIPGQDSDDDDSGVPDPEPVQHSKDAQPEPAPPKAPEPAKDPDQASAKEPDPAAPQKVAIGGKEYSSEDLEKIISEYNQPRLQDPKDGGDDESREETKPVELSPEEIAERESAFVSSLTDKISVSGVVNDDDIEDLLVGGEKAVETMTKILKQTTARAVLEARKSIYQELNPTLKQLQDQVQPVLRQTQELEQYTTTQLFNQRHPEFQQAGQIDLARNIATELMARYPKEVSKMTREQFVDEVARQADKVVQSDYKRFFPNSDKTWRDHWKEQQASQALPPADDTPRTPPSTSPEPAPKPKTPPKPKPPAAASTTIRGGQPPNWHKSVANTLAY